MADGGGKEQVDSRPNLVLRACASASLIVIGADNLAGVNQGEADLTIYGNGPIFSALDNTRGPRADCLDQSENISLQSNLI